MIPDSLTGIGYTPVSGWYTDQQKYSGNTEQAEKAAGVQNPEETKGAEKSEDAKGIEDVHKHPGRKSSPEECETCKNRKYQDGSDEMVSFKNASHISPTEAAVRVRAHEQEHVSNAYAKATQNDGKVVSANVSIRTSICPECGRTYVSGGLTTTQIKYQNEENPYQKARKAREYTNLGGAHMDAGT